MIYGGKNIFTFSVGQPTAFFFLSKNECPMRVQNSSNEASLVRNKRLLVTLGKEKKSDEIGVTGTNGETRKNKKKISKKIWVLGLKEKKQKWRARVTHTHTQTHIRSFRTETLCEQVMASE